MNPYDFYITPEEYEQAASIGIRVPLLEVRIRTLGWTKERALTTPPHKKKDYGKWPQIAKENGIVYTTFQWRVNYRGWDYERAATEPLEDKAEHARHAYSHCRKYPLSILELAKQNGVQYQTFRYRVKHGMSLEEAATKPPMTMREIGLMTKDKRQRSYAMHTRSWNGSTISR